MYDGDKVLMVSASTRLPGGCVEWEGNSMFQWIQCSPNHDPIPPWRVKRVVHSNLGHDIAEESGRTRDAAFFSSFRSFSEYVAQMQAWTASAPSRVSLKSIGMCEKSCGGMVCGISNC